MGFKYKKEEVTRIETTVEEIVCDKCKESLGKEDYNCGGGFFTPSFTWNSQFDSIGVRRGVNFTFAQDPIKVQLICEKYPHEHIIKDEYGEPLTGIEFIEITNKLNHMTNMIGEWFG